MDPEIRPETAPEKPARKPRRTPRLFTPTDEQRSMVQVLVSVAIAHDDIAAVVINPYTKRQVSIHTLRKYFAQELRDGKVRVKSFVVGQLFKLIKKGVPSAIYFYLKTQCGWRETIDVEHSLTHELVNRVDFSLLTPDELNAIESGQITQKLIARLVAASRGASAPTTG